MMTVYCVLPPSVLLTDLAGPLDALRFATRFGVDLEVQVVSNVPQVASTCGIQLAGLKPLPDVLAEVLAVSLVSSLLLREVLGSGPWVKR